MALGIGQLAAELETLRRRRNHGDNPMRGVVTDGRRWRFAELLPINHDVN